MKKRLTEYIVLALMLLIPACGPPRHFEDTFSKALTLYQDSQYDDAFNLLNPLYDQYGNEPYADKIVYLLAQIYFQKQNYAEVIRFTEGFPDRYPESGYNDLVRLLRAETWLKQNEKKRAFEVLKSLQRTTEDIALRKKALHLLAVTSETDKDWKNTIEYYRQLIALEEDQDTKAYYYYIQSQCLEQMKQKIESKNSLTQALRLAQNESMTWLPEAYAKLGDILFNEGNNYSALDAYQKSMSLAPYSDTALELRKKMSAYLKGLDGNELQTLKQRHKADLLGAEIDLCQAQLFRTKDNITEAKALMENIVTSFPGTAIAKEAETELEIMKLETTVEPSKIGILLPLSGKMAVFGQTALHGIQLAAADAQKQGKKYQFEIRDTAAQPENAAVFAEELILKEHVIALIGPLLSDCMKKIIPLIEKYHLPVITPGAPETGIPELSHYILRNSASSVVEARTIAAFAVQKMHFSQFAILYPNNPFGKELKDAFEKSIAAIGQGKVVASIPYPENETDFREPILQLKNYTFEALFIPDYANTVGLLAPQLPYNDIRDITLLGISTWNSPDLIKIGNTYVEGAYFTEPYHRGAMDPEAIEFKKKYQKTFLEAPNILAVQSYEATTILLNALSKGCQSRACLLNAIYAQKEFPGVSGKLILDAHGDFQRPVSILRITDGEMVLTE